jgi:hypothetical protein
MNSYGMTDEIDGAYQMMCENKFKGLKKLEAEYTALELEHRKCTDEDKKKELKTKMDDTYEAILKAEGKD